MIRSLLLSSAASLALATGAMAADLPNVKAAAGFAPPPPPVFSSGRASMWAAMPGFPLVNSLRITIQITVLICCLGRARGPADSPAAVRSASITSSRTISLRAWRPISKALRLAGDYAGRLLAAWGGHPYGCGEGVCDWNHTRNTELQSHLDWWGTVRGRLGYAFGNVLPYVTGGFAYGGKALTLQVL